MSEVFIISFHVKRTENSIMPANAVGAYVSCYTMGQNYERAIEKCISALSADGMRVEEIIQPINSMQASEWTKHIAAQWPTQASQMPTQGEFENSINGDKVVYGPFGAY